MTINNVWAEFANIELSDYEQKKIAQIKQQEQQQSLTCQADHQQVDSVFQTAKTSLQLKQYIATLNLSANRLQLLATAAAELIEDNKARAKKRELVQTFKTKIYNFSKEEGMNYDDVIAILYQLEQQ